MALQLAIPLVLVHNHCYEKSQKKKDQQAFLKIWGKSTVSGCDNPWFWKFSCQSATRIYFTFEVCMLFTPVCNCPFKNLFLSCSISCRSYQTQVPFLLVLGVATAVSAVHRSLPHHVSSCLRMKVFHSRPSLTYLNEVLEKVIQFLFPVSLPFFIALVSSC